MEDVIEDVVGIIDVKTVSVEDIDIAFTVDVDGNDGLTIISDEDIIVIVGISEELSTDVVLSDGDATTDAVTADEVDVGKTEDVVNVKVDTIISETEGVSIVGVVDVTGVLKDVVTAVVSKDEVNT